jgi:hypothetical protein
MRERISFVDIERWGMACGGEVDEWGLDSFCPMGVW